MRTEQEEREKYLNRVKLVCTTIREIYLHIGINNKKTIIKQLKNEIGLLEYELYNIAAPSQAYSIGTMNNRIVGERTGIIPNIAKRKIELLKTIIEEQENENYDMPISFIRKMVKPISIDVDKYYGEIELNKSMCEAVIMTHIELNAINGVSKAQILSALKDKLSIELLEIEHFSRRKAQSISSAISKDLFNDPKGAKENKRKYKNYSSKYWKTIAHS